MRCPKCHYLSFDPEPRCKNCGYDLEVADADLALRTAEKVDDSLPDLTLHERSAAASSPVTLELVRTEPDPRPEPQWEPEPDWRESQDVDEVVEATPRRVAVLERPVEMPRAPFRAPHTTAELPLFVKGLADRDDFENQAVRPGSGLGPVPMAPIQMPPARPPLGVRRTAPEPVRARPKPADRRLGPLDHDLLEDLKRVESEETEQARADAHALAHAVDLAERVEPIHRIGAAVVDTAVLGGMATFVFWATLRLCNVSWSTLGLTAVLPVLLFLVMMDLGYLLMFTAAGGQTVGKMLMGIRVVGDGAENGTRISFRQAAWRALLSMMGLGLGWLPALFGRGVTLHDRLAHTRVVRV